MKSNFKQIQTDLPEESIVLEKASFKRRVIDEEDESFTNIRLCMGHRLLHTLSPSVRLCWLSGLRLIVYQRPNPLWPATAVVSLSPSAIPFVLSDQCFGVLAKPEFFILPAPTTSTAGFSCGSIEQELCLNFLQSLSQSVGQLRSAYCRLSGPYLTLSGCSAD